MVNAPRFIYLLVPADLEEEILEPLQEHFAGDDSVEVLVERRTSERRPGVDDRILRASSAAQGERRAQTVPRDMPDLPPALEDYAEFLRVVQRLTPVRSGMEDLDVQEVVRRAQGGDPDAPTELYWRTYERVYRRLSAHLRDPSAADDAVKGTYGFIFDRLGGFDPDSEQLHAWLDRSVDAYVERRPPSP